MGADDNLKHRNRVSGEAPKSHRLGRIVFLALSGLILLAPPAGHAQQAADPGLVGRRVVQRSNELILHIEDRIIETNRVIHFYRVEHTNGPWLWVRAEGSGLTGWALADHMIPLEHGIEYFSERIRETASDVFPYVMRATLWQERNETARALKDYNDVLRLDPASGWIFNDRGILHFEQKDYEKALADFNEAIRLEPQNANFYNNRGNVRRTRKLYDLAITDFDQAIRLNPQYAFAYYNRGLTRAEKKELDKAILDFNEVVRLDPHDPLPYYHRGLAWAAKEVYDSAIRDFDQAIQRDGNKAFIYRDCGQAHAARKEYEKAIADYDQAIRLSPRSARSFLYRAMARVELKDFGKALADYDTAIRLDPTDDEPYLSRAWLLASCPNTRLRDPQKAVESATKACELTHWHDAHDLGGLAAVYAETGNVAAALKWQSKAIELMTGDHKNKVEAFALGHP